MPLGFSSRERKQEKLPKPAIAQAYHPAQGAQNSQSTVYVHPSYAAPTPDPQPHGYPGSPPQQFACSVSPPPFGGYASPPPQHHPVYGAMPQPSQQYDQYYANLPPYQQSQPYYDQSTASFAAMSPPPKHGLMNRAGRLASQSYQDLTAQVSSSAQKSVDLANKGVAVTMTTFVERPTTLVTKKSVQMINQSAALCDRLSSKLDAVITSIDEGIFSGKEQDLMVENDDTPYASASTLQPSIALERSAAAAVYPSQKNAKSSNMFSKVWLYSNSRLPPHLPPFKVYMPTYPLLCLAANYSERVYAPTALPNTESETHVPADWRSGTKAMVLKSLPRDDMNTVIFAIRGSQTFMDWAVNYKSAPSSPEGFLDDPGNLCHAGFLYVARKMIAPVAEHLRVLLQDNPTRSNCSLLITGHSAGGAVAALLYAHMMSTQVRSELSHLTGFFKRVHCITFGAPPITLLPLKPSQDKRHRKSLFYSFINEGDPVPRADKAVVKSLLKLWSSPPPSKSCTSSLTSMSKLNLTSNNLAKPDKSRKYVKPSKASLPASSLGSSTVSSPPWPVVPCTLSNAGRLIVLRQKLESTQEEDIEAVTVEDEMLRKVVYGDPVKHQMSMYKRRVELIATKAVTATD
ncbi:alpha/beta-hydrolase [Bimuria novae-zelandiae CBS 107.79]|uniref:Alpha/beta-hydrolase n=1 Tax=Bimuria novae-zelandiae CBS 107.79 TaxID=1447943 RepID=A0A6A5VGA3_9PLEO|nr:alpha/beta-hydrolase [Bimuria novae-zelandiae CBS 107.79]